MFKINKLSQELPPRRCHDLGQNSTNPFAHANITSLRVVPTNWGNFCSGNTTPEMTWAEESSPEASLDGKCLSSAVFQPPSSLYSVGTLPCDSPLPFGCEGLLWRSGTGKHKAICATQRLAASCMSAIAVSQKHTWGGECKIAETLLNDMSARFAHVINISVLSRRQAASCDLFLDQSWCPPHHLFFNARAWCR